MKKIIHSFVLLFIAGTALSAQTTPTSAGELQYRLISPLYLGGGAHMTQLKTPQSVFLNPATAAGFQRITLDVNYSNLQKFTGNTGMGHAANVGLSVPSRYGVFTGNMAFLDTRAYGATALDLGIAGHLNFTFSKEIYSDTWFGVGLVGDIGQIDGQIDGGAALNVGMLHFPNMFGKLKNFSWGISINGLGYRYGSKSRGYLNAISGNLTPALGVAFDLIDKDTTRLTLRSDIKFPSVSDLWYGLAFDLSLNEMFRISLSSSLSLRDVIAGSTETLIPSAALAFNLALGGDKTRNQTKKITEMDLQAAVAPLYNEVWGFATGVTLPFGVRDNNPPEITLDYGDTRYISPNSDEVQDELIFPYKVTDERYITSFKWHIINSLGETVRTYRSKGERPEKESIKNLWNRFISPKEGIVLPESFRWDGLNDSASIVPDGEYAIHLDFGDDNGNLASTTPLPVVLDTLPPELNLHIPEGLDLIFSPDGDGFKDILAIKQKGSTEHLWEAQIKDASGKVMKNWIWENEDLKNLKIEGINDEETLIPDGVYSYSISSTDKAGNAVSNIVEGIIIDTKRPESRLSIDKAIFSPSTDSSISTLTLTPQIPVLIGIIDWTLEIIGPDSRVKRNWSRKDIPIIPESFVFDGNSNGGQRLPEGKYFGQLKLEYGNGFRSKSVSPQFTIDMSPPEARITTNWSRFSSGNTSKRNTVVLTQNASAERHWKGSIRNKEGKLIEQWIWREKIPSTVTWNGRNAQGLLVPDGTYSYQLASTDEAGNVGTSAPVIITVDSTSPEVNISISPQPFSPDDDGIDDEMFIGIKVRDNSPIAQWRFDIFDHRQREFFTFSGKGKPSEKIIWNGLSKKGVLVESAEDYPYIFSVSDDLGNITEKKGLLPVDVLVIRDGNRLKIRISNITFEPSSPRLTTKDDKGKKNVQVLDRLASIMKKYGSYGVVVEGHATSLKWANPAAAKREQQNILLPLSMKRARTVMNELSIRGVKSNRLKAEGLGGSRPIVPHSDTEERWRNRRVEFYLEK